MARVVAAVAGWGLVAGAALPPAELCADYSDWSRCVHVKEFDAATNASLVMDTSDGKCFTYVSDKTTTKEACGAGSLRFTWHQPHPNMFKAIGVSGDLCLDTSRGGHKLWACGNENKANQHYYAGWRSQYAYPCEVFSVSSKENAQQCRCVAQEQQLHASVGADGGSESQVRVYQHCLKGRIRGGLGGRVMSSLYPENVCDGQPMPMHSLGDWTADDTMFVYWAEDADDWTTAGTHIERVRFTAAGAEVVGHIKLPKCVHNGAVARGRDGKLAVVCAEAAGWEKWLHLKVVEVEVDLSKEVRRFSVLPEGCRATGGCKGAYPMQKGADFRLLQYSASRDWYFVFYNAEWGGHVADAVTVWSGETGKQVSGYGDSWACMGGHTETGRMAYNAEADELAVLCCSDLGGTCNDPAKDNCDVDNKWKNGLVFRTHVAKKQSVTLAPFANVYYQAISGWLGDLLPCDDGYVLAWHGADGLAETFKNKTNNVGFMRVSATGEVLVKKWITTTTDSRERSVKLAKLGKGSCDRFLLGWGDMAADAYYPSRYLLMEVDKNGKQLTNPLDVTNATMWGEDTQWATLGNGDVAWGHTWKRNVDGTPNKVGQTPYKKSAGRSCTWNGNGYGYTWGSLSDRPGGRFHTNEAFTSRYAASGSTPATPTTAPTAAPTSIPSIVRQCIEDGACRANGDVNATCNTATSRCTCSTGYTASDSVPVCTATGQPAPTITVLVNIVWSVDCALFTPAFVKLVEHVLTRALGSTVITVRLVCGSAAVTALVDSVEFTRLASADVSQDLAARLHNDAEYATMRETVGFPASSTSIIATKCTQDNAAAAWKNEAGSCVVLACTPGHTLTDGVCTEDLNTSSSSSGLSDGEIAAIVICSVVVVAAIAAAVTWIFCKRGAKPSPSADAPKNADGSETANAPDL